MKGKSAAVPECKIDHKFRNTSKEMRQLLKEMLEFDPKVRKSASQLIELRIFDDIRPSNIDSMTCQKMSSNFDKHENDSSVNLSEPEHKSKLCKRILREYKKMH